MPLLRSSEANVANSYYKHRTPTGLSTGTLGSCEFADDANPLLITPFWFPKLENLSAAHYTQASHGERIDNGGFENRRTRAVAARRTRLGNCRGDAVARDRRRRTDLLRVVLQSRAGAFGDRLQRRPRRASSSGRSPLPRFPV